MASHLCVRYVEVPYRGHIGWNSSKVISLHDLPGCSLSKDPVIMDLLQRDYRKTKFWSGYRVHKTWNGVVTYL